MAGSLVLVNGRVWSPDGVGAGCDAIVVADGRIAAVTRSADAREMAGPRAHVIDLKGRLAIPAFGDAHVHPVGGGLESLRCNLVGQRSRPEYLDTIAGTPVLSGQMTGCSAAAGPWRRSRAGSPRPPTWNR